MEAKIVYEAPRKAKLTLRKIYLSGEKKWEFIDEYKEKISANIMDEEFLKMVKEGTIKNFCAGAKIDCVLKEEVEFKIKYTVNEVSPHIITPPIQNVLSMSQ